MSSGRATSAEIEFYGDWSEGRTTMYVEECTNALSKSGPTLHREAALFHRFLRRPSGSETVKRVAAVLLEHGTGPSA